MWKLSGETQRVGARGTEEEQVALLRRDEDNREEKERWTGLW